MSVEASLRQSPRLAPAPSSIDEEDVSMTLVEVRRVKAEAEISIQAFIRAVENVDADTDTSDGKVMSSLSALEAIQTQHRSSTNAVEKMRLQLDDNAAESVLQVKPLTKFVLINASCTCPSVRPRCSDKHLPSVLRPSMCPLNALE